MCTPRRLSSMMSAVPELLIWGACELARKSQTVQKGLYPENGTGPIPEPDSGNPTVRDRRDGCQAWTMAKINGHVKRKR